MCLGALVKVVIQFLAPIVVFVNGYYSFCLVFYTWNVIKRCQSRLQQTRNHKNVSFRFPDIKRVLNKDMLCTCRNEGM